MLESVSSNLFLYASILKINGPRKKIPKAKIKIADILKKNLFRKNFCFMFYCCI